MLVSKRLADEGLIDGNQLEVEVRRSSTLIEVVAFSIHKWSHFTRARKVLDSDDPATVEPFDEPFGWLTERRFQVLLLPMSRTDVTSATTEDA